MIRCACKDPICKINIKFDWCSKAMWVTDKTGKEEILMYLDANTVIELIKELKSGLMKLAGENDETDKT